MSSQGKSKKDKEIIAEYDAQVKGERRALRRGRAFVCGAAGGAERARGRGQRRAGPSCGAAGGAGPSAVPAGAAEAPSVGRRCLRASVGARRSSRRCSAGARRRAECGRVRSGASGAAVRGENGFVAVWVPPCFSWKGSDRFARWSGRP